jgi:UDP-glucose 4-epimerase
VILLVTGAGGFVCSQLAAGFAAYGHEVLALDQTFDPETQVRLKDCTLIQTSVQEAQLPNVDAIIHGAAITATPTGHISNYLTEDVTSALRLLAHSESRGGRFIQISSSAVFAESPEPSVDETSAICASSPYAAAKQMAELATLTLRNAGYDTMVVRFGHLYGPFERARTSRPRVSLVQQMIEEAVTQGQITVRQPTTRREWTFVPDLTTMLAALIKCAQFPVPLLHLASDEAVTEIELATLIAERQPGTEVVIAPEAPERKRPRFMSCLRKGLKLPSCTPLADGLTHLVSNQRITV